MQSPIEQLKQNLLEAYTYQTYVVSNILTNDGRPPAHNYLSDQAAFYIKDALTQSHKFMQCLITLEKSSEFKDFVTRMNTRTPQITMPGFFSSSPKNLSGKAVPSPQLQEAFEKLLRAFVIQDDDTHLRNVNVTGLLDFDRPDEKDFGNFPFLD